MKKPYAMLLCCVLLLAPVACGGNDADTSSSADTATTNPITAANTSATTTEATTTTTTAKPTEGKTDIVGNTRKLEYQEVDNAVYVYTPDLKGKTMKMKVAIPWDEAFSADNWALVKRDEPQSVYVYKGAEYYIDAQADYTITYTASADNVTVSYVKAGKNVQMKLSRTGNRTRKVVSDTDEYKFPLNKSFSC